MKQRKPHQERGPTRAGDPPAGRAPGAPRAGGGEWGEPVVQRRWTPLWLVFLLGILFYWGQLYLDKNAAGFDARVYDAFHSFAEVDALRPKDEAAMMAAKGKALFEGRCVQCHQTTGLGVPGQFPPLADSEWVKTPGAGRMIRIATHGLNGAVQVKGQTFNNVMPPGLTDDLSDEQLASLLTYVRGAWGNNAPPVKPAEVKTVREAIKGRAASWTPEELKAVPETE